MAIGKSPLIVPVIGDVYLSNSSEIQRTLKWLNCRLNETEETQIRKALRRTKFDLTANRTNRKLQQLHMRGQHER